MKIYHCSTPEGSRRHNTAWAAAHVDEDWQMSQWGGDDDALARRAYRRAEFDAAVAVLSGLNAGVDS